MTLVDPGDFTPPYDEALARGLVASGAEVRLIGHIGFPGASTQGFRKEHFYRLHDRALRSGVHGVVLRLLKGLEHGLDMHRLAQKLSRCSVDIVHFQWLPLPLMDYWHVRRIGARAPTVLTLHDSVPYNGAGSLVMRLGQERLLHAFDAVIVHTKEARERLLESGHAPDRVHMLPHGLLHPAIDHTSRCEPVTGDHPLRLLHFGKIKPYKGIDILLEAIHRLSPECQALFHVQIVGKPYMDTSTLHAQIERYGLSNTVDLRLDFVSDREMHALFAGADVVVCPYRSIDASGNAMTAMAHGVPLIASNVGMFSELFSDGKGAILVPAGEPGPLAEAFSRVVLEPGLLDSLRHGMHAKRSAMPDWVKIAEMTMAVYEQAYGYWRSPQ